MSLVSIFRRRRRSAVTSYTPVATSFAWLDSAPTLAAFGATAPLRAAVLDQRGIPMANQTPYAISYSSGTPSVATVNASTGTVTAVANGSSVITASATGYASITRTATVSQQVASITGVSSTLSTDDASSGTFSPVGKDANNNTVSGATFSYASSTPSVITVNASTGAWAGQSAGSATITITGTPGGATFTVGVTVTHVVGYATPLVKDDMGYVTNSALLANVQTAGGGTGGTGGLYSDILTSSAITLTPDRSATALYNGFASVRYDFNPSGTNDNQGYLTYSFPTPRKQVWGRFRVKFKPGFSVVGDAGAGAQAYKFFLYGLNNNGWTGSGRLEFVGTNYDNYWNTSAPEVNANHAPLSGMGTEWSDGRWYHYIALLATSADGKTLTVKWWLMPEGGSPVLISTVSGTSVGGNVLPLIDGMRHGANFNQTRSSTVTLWRGPWDLYDAAIYQNPYNVPSADLTDVAALLGTNAGIAQPVTAPAPPGVPSPSNASGSTTTSLTFPVTLNAAGGVPTALLTRYSTDGGTTWTTGPDIGLVGATLGGSVAPQIGGLSAGTPYTVQFAEYNAGGTSAWSTSVTGTTASSDTLPVTSGLVLRIAANSSPDVTTNGAAITTLTDQSASGINFTQNTAGNKPTLVTNYQNGLPVIQFATSKYIVANAYNDAINTPTSGKQTFFLVFAVPTASSTNVAMLSNTDGSAGWEQYLSPSVNADAPHLKFFAGADMNEVGRSASLNVISVELDPTIPTKITTYVNGTSVGGDGTAPTFNRTVPLAFGTRASAVGTLTGASYFAEVVIYNRLLTTTERQSVETFLRTKWGTA